MNLSKYFKDLIFRNECIIVPGFGGFETHYKPAYFDKSTGKLNPPSKKIIFKSEYKKDGGVLYNYIAEKEKCNIEGAMEKVEDWVKDITGQLDTKGYYIFEGLGRLFRTETGILEFESIENENYLIDSYGLSDIKITEIESVEEISLPAEELVTKEKRSSSKRILYFLSGLSLLILAIVLILKNPGFNEKLRAFFDGTSTKKHKKEQKIVFGHRPDPSFKDEHTTNKLNDRLDEKTDKQKALFYKEPEKHPEITKVEVKHEIKQSDSFGEEKRYIIVAGSFLKQSFAAQLQKTLIAQGYHPEIIKTENGLYRVALESLDDIDLALQKLEKYKKELDNMVWILRI